VLAARPIDLELVTGCLMPRGHLAIHCQKIKRLGFRNSQNSEDAVRLTAMMGLVIEPMCQQIPQNESCGTPLVVE
jgi:hypothetical protein